VADNPERHSRASAPNNPFKGHPVNARSTPAAANRTKCSQGYNPERAASRTSDRILARVRIPARCYCLAPLASLATAYEHHKIEDKPPRFSPRF
jgi:hypothetical protein